MVVNSLNTVTRPSYDTLPTSPTTAPDTMMTEVDKSCAARPLSANRPLSAQPAPFLREDSKANVLERYTCIKTIGEGAQGRVKFATDNLTGKEVAIKFVPINGSHGELAKKEMSILQSIPDHPGVCRLVDSIVTPNDFVMVLELLPADLFGVLENTPFLTAKDVKRISKRLLEGIAHCHQHGVAHRDIKPENILLDNADISSAFPRICDFGLAGPSNRMAKSVCGSQSYTAPEVLSGKLYDPTKADVWSIGVVMYNISTSYAPWSVAARSDRVFDRFCSVRGDFWEWSLGHSPQVVTPEFVQLFDSLCNPDPTKRLTATQALRLPYFTEKSRRPPVQVVRLPSIGSRRTSGKLV